MSENDILSEFDRAVAVRRCKYGVKRVVWRIGTESANMDGAKTLGVDRQRCRLHQPSQNATVVSQEANVPERENMFHAAARLGHRTCGRSISGGGPFLVNLG